MDNEVVSVGQIGKKEIYLLLGYRHKAYDCEAIRLRSNSADKSAEARQAERILVAQHEKKRRLEKVVFVLGYQDSNLE